MLLLLLFVVCVDVAGCVLLLFVLEFVGVAVVVDVRVRCSSLFAVVAVLVVVCCCV